MYRDIGNTLSLLVLGRLHNQAAVVNDLPAMLIKVSNLKAAVVDLPNAIRFRWQ